MNFKDKPAKFHPLKRTAKIEAGDRAFYVDNNISPYKIGADDIGLTVAESGYFGVCRRIKPPVLRSRSNKQKKRS